MCTYHNTGLSKKQLKILSGLSLISIVSHLSSCYAITKRNGNEEIQNDL